MLMTTLTRSNGLLMRSNVCRASQKKQKFLIVKVFFCFSFIVFPLSKKYIFFFFLFHFIYLFINNAINGWCGETEDPASVCFSATTTRTWRWNISGQVRLILGPRFVIWGLQNRPHRVGMDGFRQTH